jgi:hypothetical protein
MYHLDFRDLLLGKSSYSNEVVETIENVVIPMPEGKYIATMQFEISTWKRPRWKAEQRKYTCVKLDNPPRFPGKGENSWDCGDDGIYGCSVAGHDLSKAIGDYVYRVTKYREERAGRRAILQAERGEE